MLLVHSKPNNPRSPPRAHKESFACIQQLSCCHICSMRCLSASLAGHICWQNKMVKCTLQNSSWQECSGDDFALSSASWHLHWMQSARSQVSARCGAPGAPSPPSLPGGVLPRPWPQRPSARPRPRPRGARRRGQPPLLWLACAWRYGTARDAVPTY